MNSRLLAVIVPLMGSVALCYASMAADTPVVFKADHAAEPAPDGSLSIVIDWCALAQIAESAKSFGSIAVPKPVPIKVDLPGLKFSEFMVIRAYRPKIGGWLAFGLATDSRSVQFFASEYHGVLRAEFHSDVGVMTIKSNGQYTSRGAALSQRKAVDWQCSTECVGNRTAPFRPHPGLAGPQGSVPVVDVAMLYTAAFREAEGGGTEDAVARILQYIAYANLAYYNSLVDLEIDCTFTYEVDYDETGMTSDDMLAALTASADGQMDESGTIRESTQADLIALLGVNGTGAGVAQMGIDPDNCYSVSSSISQSLFSHEVGHNFGLGHFRGDPTGDNSYREYAHGYRYNFDGIGTLDGTIMVGNPIGPYYSNPDVDYPGTAIPMGIAHPDANSADCALALNTDGMTVAGYRTGASNLNDCDNDGTIDAIKLFYGGDSDYGGQEAMGGGYEPNDVPDSCDRAAWAADCHNAVADPAIVQWEVELGRSSLPRLSGANGTTRYAEFRGVPEPQSEVEITVVAAGNFDTTSRELEIYVNDELAGVLFTTDGSNCSSTSTGSVAIGYDEFDFDTQDPVLVIKTVSVGIGACATGPSESQVTVRYKSTMPDNLDRDGVLDTCDPSCSRADIQTPYGTIDFYDMQRYLALFCAMDDEADIAPPLGVWDFADVSAYQNYYSQGCP